VTQWVRLAVAAAVLGALVWRLGTGPFLDGLRAVDGASLAAACALALLTTLCCAWRWRIVAGRLGLDLALGSAVAAYYRSLFLNLTLPGGVVGDVHRGIAHGRDTRDVRRGLRGVVWERGAGQAVQIVLTVAVLLTLPSPLQHAMPLVVPVILVAAVAVALAVRRHPVAGAWPAITLASALVVAGHAATFLLAAHAAGAAAPPSTLVPLALLVLLGGALPNVGGWGPREGVAAWAFAAAGLGAAAGVATSVAYGVMVLVASLPGAVLLVVGTGAPPRLTRPRTPQILPSRNGATDA